MKRVQPQAKWVLMLLSTTDGKRFLGEQQGTESRTCKAINQDGNDALLSIPGRTVVWGPVLSVIFGSGALQGVSTGRLTARCSRCLAKCLLCKELLHLFFIVIDILREELKPF